MDGLAPTHHVVDAGTCLSHRRAPARHRGESLPSGRPRGCCRSPYRRCDGCSGIWCGSGRLRLRQWSTGRCGAGAISSAPVNVTGASAPIADVKPGCSISCLFDDRGAHAAKTFNPPHRGSGRSPFGTFRTGGEFPLWTGTSDVSVSERISLPDPACVKTRTGPISTNYLYKFKLIHREIHGVGGLTRHKVAQTSDTSAFLHNQDPMPMFPGISCPTDLACGSEKCLHFFP